MTNQPAPPIPPQPPQSSPMQMPLDGQQPGPARSGPGGLWYLIGVLILLAGLGGAVALIATAGFGEMIKEITQSPTLTVPGTTEVVIDKPGPRTLYVNTRDADAWPDELGFAVTDAGGKPVETSTPTMNQTMTIHQEQYVGVMNMAFQEPTTVSVEATLAEDADDTDIDARLGPGMEFATIGKMGMRVLLAVVVGLVGLVLGVLTLVLTAVKRGKARRSRPAGFGP